MLEVSLAALETLRAGFFVLQISIRSKSYCKRLMLSTTVPLDVVKKSSLRVVGSNSKFNPNKSNGKSGK